MIKVEGRVTYPSGSPAKGVFIRLVNTEGQPMELNLQKFSVKTDANGDFQIYLPDQAFSAGLLQASAESGSGKVLKQDMLSLDKDKSFYDFILGRDTQEEDSVTYTASHVSKEKNKYLLPIIGGSILMLVILFIILKKRNVI